MNRSFQNYTIEAWHEKLGARAGRPRRARWSSAPRSPGYSGSRCGSRPAWWRGNGWPCTEKHHAFTDKPRHSPYLEGFWSIQLGNIFYYVKEARNPATVEKYARDIKEDAWDRWLFNHGILGLAVGIT